MRSESARTGETESQSMRSSQLGWGWDYAYGFVKSWETGLCVRLPHGCILSILHLSLKCMWRSFKRQDARDAIVDIEIALKGAWPGRVAQAPRAGRALASWFLVLLTPCWRVGALSRCSRLEDQLGFDGESNSKIAADGSDSGTCRARVTSIDLLTSSASTS